MLKIQKLALFQHSKTVPDSLRRRWWAVTLIYGTLCGCGYLLLPASWHQQGLARWWAVQAALVLAYLLWNFQRGLPDNHRNGEATLLPALGLGNSLTLLRGLAIGLLAGFLFLPRPTGGLFAWTPAILYAVIIVLDYLDGYAARMTNHVTKLGETLDGICDTLALLIAITLLVSYGQIPAWYLLVGLTPYLYRLALWWRQRRQRPIFDLPSSRQRRMLAGFQMGFISVLLWPLNYPTTATALVGVAIAAPILAGFWRDWLVVSGRLDPHSVRYRTWHRRLSVVFEAWLPSLLRVGVVLLSLIYLWPIALSTVQREALFLWPSTPNPALTVNLPVLLTLVTTLMLGLGLLTRLAALGLLVPTVITILVGGFSELNGSLLVGLMALMLLGGGRWSLWRLDDIWVTIKAGTAR
jgi:CDP-diacylglycerol--glycerol-3-phosphate 3-phosphatidyltransferase